MTSDPKPRSIYLEIHVSIDEADLNVVNIWQGHDSILKKWDKEGMEMLKEALARGIKR